MLILNKCKKKKTEEEKEKHMKQDKGKYLFVLKKTQKKIIMTLDMILIFIRLKK